MPTSPSVLDLHGASWRDWIIENLERRCDPEELLSRMLKTTWKYEQAVLAIDEGLALLVMPPTTWRSRVPTIPNEGTIQLDNRAIRVLGRFANPRAALLDGLLNAEECSNLIGYAYDKGLRNSGVVDGMTGESIKHHARTSTSVFLTRAETPLIDTIESRLSQLTNWPISHGEGLQVLRYEAGQEYKPHFDWFDLKKPGSANHLKRGGQRVGTTIIYLATPEEGGGTQFPKSGVQVYPRAGGAIFFANVDVAGRPDETSLHSGMPVVKGSKIVATYWQREGPFR